MGTDSISRDERDAPLTQYITNAGITRVRYTITHFKHHHRVLWLISNRTSVYHRYNYSAILRTPPREVKKSRFGILFLFLLSSNSRSSADIVVSSDARLHVNPLNFLARSAVC